MQQESALAGSASPDVFRCRVGRVCVCVVDSGDAIPLPDYGGRSKSLLMPYPEHNMRV